MFLWQERIFTWTICIPFSLFHSHTQVYNTSCRQFSLKIDSKKQKIWIHIVPTKPNRLKWIWFYSMPVWSYAPWVKPLSINFKAEEKLTDASRSWWRYLGGKLWQYLFGTMSLGHNYLRSHERVTIWQLWRNWLHFRLLPFFCVQVFSFCVAYAHILAWIYKYLCRIQSWNVFRPGISIHR